MGPSSGGGRRGSGEAQAASDTNLKKGCRGRLWAI